MDSKWKKKREKAIVLVCLETKKLRLPDLCKKTKLSKTLRVTTSNYRLFLLVDHSDKIPVIHFPVNLFSANGERPVRTTFHFWFRLYSSQGIVLWDAAISHQPMVLCKGSPEKCCPAHCFFLIPFFF